MRARAGGLSFASDGRFLVPSHGSTLRSNAEAERIGDHGIRVADQCSNTGTRPPAERLRRKILTLLPDLDGPLVLDFTGVRSASSSFLDELLGRLAAQFGREDFYRRVRVIGMDLNRPEFTGGSNS